MTEFIVAMHLLASYRAGALRALPQTLPQGLYEAAVRRGVPLRQSSGSRPTSDVSPISAIPRQLSGAGPPRTSSPLSRPPHGSHSPAQPQAALPQNTGDWGISPQEKAHFDTIFSTIDTEHFGHITGEQAVGFFSNSRLPENDLAQIWDLADINSEGRLSRDEFAVAMHLIRQQMANKDGSAVLPQTLPSNLIPPSMRRQPIAPPQSTAPTFDNAANITKPRSAADDLFGLDALSSAPTQVPQSTGGSTTFTPVSPQPTGSPQQSQQPQQSSIFKPFVPSSSFGKHIMTPQATGASATGGTSTHNRAIEQQQQKPPVEDDLLGDNDPEVSKRLTQETTELANLSNQVGTLTNQMQQVKSKRASTEQDLSQVNSQKRDFESRLAQLRSAYEQEVKDTKGLEDRLVTLRNETRKVQQEIAMVQSTHQELQAQHQQLATALDADQRENASLKEKMRQISAEIGELKPQLEKMRSDARQQKGLVAINKKQLSTNELERDKVKGDLDGASRELSEATRELEESKRSIQSNPQTQAQTPAAVASPAPSTASQSMNPFFRRPTNPTSEKALPQSPFSSQPLTLPNHNAFDSFFGPSFGSSSPGPSGQPFGAPFSTGTESPEQSRETIQEQGPFGQPNKPFDLPETQTQSTSSPTSARNELPQNSEPPPPPQSRQITSSFLPFREHLPRSSSTSSSVKVAPPASQFGDDFGLDTPKTHNTSHSFTLSETPNLLEKTDTNRTETATPMSPSPLPERSTSISSSQRTPARPDINTRESNDKFHDFGQPSAAPEIPGSFPGDSTPSMHTPQSTFDQTEEPPRPTDLPSKAPSSMNDDLSPIASQQSRSSPAAKDDFESAFAGFGSTSSSSRQGNKDFPTSGGFGGLKQSNIHEFPPIHELGGDDESDSDSDRGFDDNFTAASSHHQQDTPGKSEKLKPINGIASEQGSNETTQRPEFDRTLSTKSQPPTPGAQMSPPTYDQTTSPSGPAHHRDSNQFPAEYSGLLPSREALVSPPQTPQSPEAKNRLNSASHTDPTSFHGVTAKERAASGSSLPLSQMPMSPGTSSTAPYAYSQTSSQPIQSQPPVPPKNVFDDFDNEFGDLSEAKEADEKGDEDFGSPHRHGYDDFNPVFDSPAPSKAATSTTAPESTNNQNAFHDFESSFSSPSQASTSRLPSQPQPANTAHDWDAMFAGLDTPSHSNGTTQPFVPSKAETSPTSPLTKPPLGRALTEGTEHDDPILKVGTEHSYIVGTLLTLF